MKIVNRQPTGTADASSNRGQMWSELRRLILYAALLVVAVFLSIGWVVDLIVPSISVEREAALFSRWTPGKKPSTESTAKLQPAREILDRLTQDPAVPRLPYRLVLVENPKPNAFAFPGGTIGLTSGLLETLDNQTALTFVLGHELGHFHQRDHLRGLGRAIGGSIAFSILFGGEMGSSQFADTFTYILGRSYSRDQEEGADLFGLGLVFRVYGKTEGCDQLFKVLQESDETPEWAYMLSTHPAPATRIEQLRQEALHLRQAQP
ncbi:MAG: M48 family metallopeptidase [Verrucomicrobiota bacterium]